VIRRAGDGVSPRMRTPTRSLFILSSLALSTALAGCIIDDDPESGSTSIDAPPLTGVPESALSDLASFCGYHEMYVANVEAFDPPPPDFDPYAMTDACRDALEAALAGPLGLEIDIAEEPVRQVVLEAIHALLFTPLFTPVRTGDVPPVFVIGAESYPYPAALADIIPDVPPTYTFEIPPEHYNPEIAELLFLAVTRIDADLADSSATARFEGGTITLLGKFGPAFVTNPRKTAALLAHEAAHATGVEHIACSNTAKWCVTAVPTAGAACDCGYENSPYWLETALAQSLRLGRMISFGPGATDPIAPGVVASSSLDASICEEAKKHVITFRDAGTKCIDANDFLVQPLVAASDYWEYD
jgi:hypothetical protein